MEMKITKIAFYVRDISRIADFYARHFGFVVRYNEKKDKAILSPTAGGCRLILLQASKGHKTGQSIVKLLFDVADVAAAREEHAKKGLKFGPILRGPNYHFANARDPAKNLISISDAHLVDE
jgi:predicted enzyme related to lactoylglutathione lyase